MGRRKRLLAEAINRGEALSYKQERSKLMAEVMRLATPTLFADTTIGARPTRETCAIVADAMKAVLPQALSATNTRYFTTAELTRSPDWDELCTRVISSVCANNQEFRRASKVEHFALRKGKGRRATGEWVFCVDCGVPRWATASRRPQRCRSCWKQHMARRKLAVA